MRSIGDRLRFFVEIIAAVGAVCAGIFTWQQAQVAKDTEKRQLRAYVWVAPGNIWDLDVGKVPRIPVTIRNGGLTPAYMTGTLLAVKTMPVSKDGERIRVGVLSADLSPEEPGRGDFIYQDHYTTIFVPNLTPLDQATYERVRRGELAIYAFGRVNYRDVFDKRHFVGFCYFWTADRPPGHCDSGEETDHND